MKIEWSEEAARSIDAILLDIYERRGKARAAVVANELAAHVAHLETHPHMGRMVPDLDRPDVRELLKDGYRIIYVVHVDSVEILAVVTSSRPLPRLVLPPIDDE